MGGPLESCTVQADGFRKAGATADPGTIVQQVKAALSDRDLELDAGQAALLRFLGSLPDEAATQLLVDLAGSPSTPATILEGARTALAGRRTGARSLVAALERRYDFLHDALSPPPVGAIALALSAMNAPPETGAARVLSSHLFEPADSDRDVRDVAQALTVLATPAEAPALLRFLALYRAAPEDSEELPQAVIAAGEALLRVGGAEGKAAIAAAVAKPSTNPQVRARLGALLEAQAAVKP
jgi:outer membrane protein assembly factor BamB